MRTLSRLLAVLAAAILCLFTRRCRHSAQTDTGLSDEAWTAIALSGAFVVVLGGIVFVARRRHHGHLAHPV